LGNVSTDTVQYSTVSEAVMHQAQVLEIACLRKKLLYFY